MEKETKVKIIDIKYEKENNLFQLVVEKLDSKERVTLGVRGTDWGVTSKVSMQIIEQFCNNMKGKEKNLMVEIEEPSIKKDGVSMEEMNKIHDDLNNYPISEIISSLPEETENES